MSADERWFPSHLGEMTEEECLEQLATNQVGRVSYCDQAGPVVLPVNYRWEQGSVLFRTSPDSLLAKYMDSEHASFQIDEYDVYNQSGWSVLVRGAASHVGDAELPDDELPMAWAEGARTLRIRIIPHEVSGRWLLPG
jgi:nitroimidazol reductase NimA-like FMN-containing flavoprotein (pyridoxamine 5'-phosphate oxidase superfamily)